MASEQLLNTEVYNDTCWVPPSKDGKTSTIIVVHRRSKSNWSTNLILFFGGILLLSLFGRCLYKNFYINHKLDRIVDYTRISGEVNNFENEFQVFVDDYKNFLKNFVKNPTRGDRTDEKLRERQFEGWWNQVKHLQEFNKGKTNFTINKFFMYNDEDLKKFVIPHDFPKPKFLKSAKSFDTAPGFDLSWDYQRPESFDWRKNLSVTGVKDQGQCGSCWAFSITAVVEAQNKIFNNELYPLSEQELVDCDSRDRGCNGGFRGWGFEFVKNTGLVPEKSYTYDAQKEQCRLPLRDQKRVYVDEIYSFDGNEDEMADWVATKGPITIGVNVTRGMFAYKSGIFDPTDEDCAHNSVGSHALAVIGYGVDNGVPYWTLKNSWGAAHGESGYIRMKRGSNSCGIANNVYTALITKHR